MKLPQIVFQTSPRWFVVSKPPGWALAARVTHDQPSVERYLTPISGSKRLYFPMETDTRISAISIVCTDRGIQAQFEKFKELRLIHCTYRVHIDCACIDIDKDILPQGVNIRCDEENRMCAHVETDQPLTMKRLSDSVGGRLCNHDVKLYRIGFPDPLNPKSAEHLIVEDSLI